MELKRKKMLELASFNANETEKSLSRLFQLIQDNDLWESTLDGNKTKEMIRDAEELMSCLNDTFAKLADGYKLEDIRQEMEDELDQFMNS